MAQALLNSPEQRNSARQAKADHPNGGTTMYASRYRRILSAFCLLMLLPALAFAEGLDAGDTAWMLVSSALVLLMLPGLALFYGGMVRAKNVMSTSKHIFDAMAIIGVQWVAFGYSLAFGGAGTFIGGLQ
jgi:Amt family ammonium transporter